MEQAINHIIRNIHNTYIHKHIHTHTHTHTMDPEVCQNDSKTRINSYK